MTRDLNAMWRDVCDFNDRYFPNWRTSDFRLVSNALAGEVGEVCDATKHQYGGGTHRRVVTHRHVIEELADVFVYLVLLSEGEGWDVHAFASAVEDKMAENRRRVDP